MERGELSGGCRLPARNFNGNNRGASDGISGSSYLSHYRLLSRRPSEQINGALSPSPFYRRSKSSPRNRNKQNIKILHESQFEITGGLKVVGRRREEGRELGMSWVLGFIYIVLKDDSVAVTFACCTTLWHRVRMCASVNRSIHHCMTRSLSKTPLYSIQLIFPKTFNNKIADNRIGKMDSRASARPCSSGQLVSYSEFKLLFSKDFIQTLSSITEPSFKPKE